MPYRLRQFFRRAVTFHHSAVTRIYLWHHGILACDVPRCIGPRPTFAGGGSIQLGSSCIFQSYRLPVCLATGPKGQIVVGHHVFINDGVNIYAEALVQIGNHTRIADDVTIYDTNFHPTCPEAPVGKGPVLIGRNVWIGCGVMILPNVTIGNHAVVAAHAVVTRSVPPCSIVAGNPAKVINTFDCPDDWVRP